MPENPDASPENPDVGPFLLKLARDTITWGENPNKALEYAIRASKLFEINPGSGLELAMSLHVVAAIYCRLGRLHDAIPVLQRSIHGTGPDHALAKYAGYMQLGDTYSMLGQLDRSIACYESGLIIQIEALTESHPKVADTCRYLAEAHVQAMQMEEAKKYCKKTLDIHKQQTAVASPEEASDRRLMALIFEAMGDYDSALEHLLLASLAMIAGGHENDVAAIDISIGDIYSSLCRFDEAIFCYHKALAIFNSTKSHTHELASLFLRLAHLHLKTANPRHAVSYADSALRIYEKPTTEASAAEICGGLVEVSMVYEAAKEGEMAVRVLEKARKVLVEEREGGSAIGGIEAKMGMVLYMVGRYKEAREAFAGAVRKMGGDGERRRGVFGMVLNQMGLACIQVFRIEEAVGLFQEARRILEVEYGECHPDTIGVCSNLAAALDAMGRVGEAIEILEHILKVREEMVGTANPEVAEERTRLHQLLKDAGMSRTKHAKSLQNLLGSNSLSINKQAPNSCPGFRFTT